MKRMLKSLFSCLGLFCAEERRQRTISNCGPNRNRMQLEKGCGSILSPLRKQDAKQDRKTEGGPV